METSTRSQLSGNRFSGFVGWIIFLCLVPLLSSCRSGTYPIEKRIRNTDEVVDGIRRGLKERAGTITVRFSYGSNIFDDLNSVIGTWVEAALAETDDPAEGDYIRYQYGGYTYKSSYFIQNGRMEYTVVLTPVYYEYLEQEEKAAKEAGELLKEFGFDETEPEIAKIRTIYAWLCENVKYDGRYLKNPEIHRNSTAYAALVLHLASCQGYCTAAYRLLRSSGVTCRIVTGIAGEDEFHAWLIVLVDGKWYQLDPTWDASNEEYQYFLGGMESFADHTADDSFMTAEFLGKYPMSALDYPG